MNELGNHYISIGTGKGCFFVPNSRRLMILLDKYPSLYYAVEESLMCAQKGYYAGGILAFSQLINLFNEETPPERHSVAHKMLIEIPSKKSYDKVVNQFKLITQKVRDNELKKSINKAVYNKEIEKLWRNLTKPPIIETDVE